MEKAIFTLSLRRYACLLLLLASAMGMNSVNAQDCVPSALPGIAVGDLGPNLLINPGFEDGPTGPAIAYAGGITTPGWFFFGADWQNVYVEGPGAPNYAAGPPLDPNAIPPEDQYVKMFGQFTGGFNATGGTQTFPAVEGQTFKADIQMLTHTDDNILAGANFIELHIEYYDVNGNPIPTTESFSSSERFDMNNFSTGTSSADYGTYTSISTAPPGTASGTYAFFFFQNPGFDGGAVYFDNASIREVMLQENIEVNLCPGETTANIDVTFSEAAAFAGLSEFTNDFNGTDDASGDYPVGTTTVTYTATSNAFNPFSCLADGVIAVAAETVTFSFDVVVNPFVATGESMACNDHVNISIPMGGVTGVPITADMILEGAAPNCIQNLDVNINGTGNNLVFCSDIGSTLMVTLTDTETGNSCWSTITIEDKLAPICLNPANGTITCAQGPDEVPAPMFEDNCGGYTVALVSEITTGAICTGDLIVTKSWVATDAYGNVSEPCVQVINVDRLAINFGNDFDIDCQIYANNPAVTHPDATGYPFGANADACGFAFSYQDEEVTSCGSSFKIVRTWTVLDWCTGEIVTEDAAGNDNVQVIKVTDNTAPIISSEDVTVSANVSGAHPQPCSSTDFIAAPEVTDNCNTTSIRIFTPIGEVNYVFDNDGNVLGGNIPAAGLDVGTHVGNYQAEDACGNISNSPFNIVVVDDIAPVTVCDQITDVSLDSEGLAVVHAETFDDGSHDNCGIESIAVRRMTDNCGIAGNTAFGSSVTFCCADIAASPIMVVFQVTDYAGNSNTCMVEVFVEDKIAPIQVACPGPEAIDCDVYLSDYAASVSAGEYDLLEEFGVASFYDNCDFDMTYDVTVDINTCSEGTITRTWTASDSNGSTTCTQVITVNHVNDWSVQFPADVPAECTDGALPDFGEPEAFNDDCELIGMSYNDTQYDVVPDACYKIVREWSVINWCIFDQFGSDVFANPQVGARTFTDGGDGFITYEQIIKVTDNEAPTFTLAEIDGCIIAPTASGEACMKDIVLPYPTNMDDCSNEYKVDINGDLGIFNDIQGAVTITDVEPGEYTVSYNVTDKCGNFTAEDVTINVVDCKKPTPYCVNGIVVEIMQTLSIDVWASDLDAGSFDNCPGDLNLYFNNDPTMTSITFLCGDVGENVVELWVEDASGNKDYCEVSIYVQNNMGSCPVPFVAGTIATQEDIAVEGANVDVNGGLANADTDANGAFGFDLQEGGDYSINPTLDANPSQGVTTYDIVLVSKHILGLAPFTSPYTRIAADANNSGSITTYDMVIMRRIILGLDTNFQNNTSWRFVDASYAFPQAANPWAEIFPEVININNLTGEELNNNFVGIKVGDVNNSASFAQNADERNVENLVFSADNAKVEAGETFTVNFSADAVDAYQFTMNYSDLELVSINNINTADENFGTFEGAITASWNGKSTTGEQFGVTFKANRAAQLNELISINSSITKAEAYNNGEAMNIVLDFGATADAFVLYQNTPNPFNGETVISFNLENAGEATLTIQDVTGKTLSVVTQEFAKGYNAVTVSDLKATGVMYYTLSAANQTVTRKMVNLK